MKEKKIEFKYLDYQSTRIQIIRGICIFGVVLIHCTVLNQYDLFIQPFAFFCVWIFLFLSGILTSPFSESWGKLIYKRIMKVIIPFFVWSLIYELFNGIDKSTIIRILTGQSCSIYYYILVYIQIVLLTPLIAKLVKSRVYWIGYLISFVAIIAEYYLALNNNYPTYPFNLNNCFVWLTIFFFGMRCRCRQETETIKEKSKKQINTYLVLGIVLYHILILLMIGEAFIWREMGQIVLGNCIVKLSTFMGSMVLANVIFCYINYIPKSANTNELSKLFVEVGNASFGIYLIHQLIIGFINKLQIWQDVNFVLKTLIILAISYCIVKVLHLVMGKFGKILGV